MATPLPRYSFTTIFLVPKLSCTISTEVLVSFQRLQVQKAKYLPESFLYLFICGFRIHLQYLKETMRAEQIQ